jgi:probable HAF family extracellular repeat protein
VIAMIRRLWVVTAVFAAVSWVLAPAAAASKPPTVTFLGDLGGGLSWPLDINDDGLIVGYGETQPDAPFGGPIHAFVWDGAMHDLGVAVAGDNSVALGLSASGLIVGESGGLPVFWSDRVLHVLPLPSGHLSGNARAVNDGGVIVGQTHSFEPPGFSVTHAVVWEHGVPRVLPSLPGARITGATDLNEQGQIVGFSAFTESGLLHAVLWEGGTVRDLGALDGDFFSGTDSINERGQIVGFSSGVDGSQVLVWQDGGFAIPRPFAQFPNSYAGGINDRGEIAATVYLPTGECCSAVLAKGPDKGQVEVVEASAFSVDVNKRGQVIGVDTSGPEYRGFVWGR